MLFHHQFLIVFYRPQPIKSWGQKWPGNE